MTGPNEKPGVTNNYEEKTEIPVAVSRLLGIAFRLP